jgi:hypothetical protein
MQIPEAAQQSRQLLDVLQQVVIGKEAVLQHILLGIYSGGNVLTERRTSTGATAGAMLLSAWLAPRPPRRKPPVGSRLASSASTGADSPRHGPRATPR